MSFNVISQLRLELAKVMFHDMRRRQVVALCCCVRKTWMCEDTVVVYFLDTFHFEFHLLSFRG